MATTPMKSPLHNFPPTYFKWGSKTKPHPHPHHQRCRRSPSTPPPPPEERESGKAAEDEPEAEVEGEKPWNLRPRRTTTTTITTTHAKITSSSTELAPPRPRENYPKSTRFRGIDSYGLADKRMWIALSKEEIEEDIYALTGSRPSRRPNKRPKNVQKQVDNVFPGLWLTGISAETYRKLQVHNR